MKLSDTDRQELRVIRARLVGLTARLESGLVAEPCGACGAKRYNDFALFQTVEKLRGIDKQLVNLEERAKEA